MANFDDDILTRVLADINYSIKELKVKTQNNEETLKNVVRNIETITFQSWEKVISRKDLKIESKIDKRLIIEMENLALATKQNAEAIVFVKESIDEKLKSIDSTLKSLYDFQRRTSLTEIEAPQHTPAEKKEKQTNKFFNFFKKFLKSS